VWRGREALCGQYDNTTLLPLAGFMLSIINLR
jgi:hypothetical protein